MLINTVILFLRDALPIFVLVVYLYVHLPATNLWLLLCAGVGALLSLIYINQIHLISQLFDGNGIELSLWICQVFVYLLALVLGYGLNRNRSSNKNYLYWTAGLMVSLTLVSKGSNFVLYFDGYFSQSNAIQSMLLGTFLGLGICLSLAILLYLTAQWLKQQLGPWSTWLLVHIYVTGQLVNALPLLVQVDFLDSSATAWSSQYFVSIEFDRLFNVLFGYQAAPSIAQVIVYALALLTPLLIFYWLKLHSASHLGIK